MISNIYCYWCIFENDQYDTNYESAIERIRHDPSMRHARNSLTKRHSARTPARPAYQTPIRC